MRILLVEDEEMTAAVMCGTLTSMGHEVTVATDGLDAWRKIQDEHFPLVLTDWMMPGLDGPTLCRRIRTQGDAPYTYIFLLSVRDRRADLIAGLRAGADDFLGKPIDASELAARLKIARRILMTHEALERQDDRSVPLASADESADPANRGEFQRKGDGNFGPGRSQNSPLSLILVDIDHFKEFNDAYGHVEGDAALRTFAGVLQANCRAHELAAHHGGEEFAIVLWDASSEEARRSAERIRTALRECQWPHRPLTASFGITTSYPITTRFAACITDLVEQADAALYHSKQQGRDRVTLREEMPDRRAPSENPRGEIGSFVSS